MAVAKLIAAAAFIILAASPREFGIGGGVILCVPERELDTDAMPYAPSPKHLRDDGTPALAFQFSADEVRRDVPQFAVDPHVADLRPANTLAGTVAFVKAADRPHYAADMTCRQETLHRGTGDAIVLHTCTRVTLIDGLWVTYDVQKRNLTLADALDRFLRTKIAAWRDNCHATDRM